MTLYANHGRFCVELNKVAGDIVQESRNSDKNDSNLQAYIRGRLWELCVLYGFSYHTLVSDSPCEEPANNRTHTRQEPPDRQSGRESPDQD